MKTIIALLILCGGAATARQGGSRETPAGFLQEVPMNRIGGLSALPALSRTAGTGPELFPQTVQGESKSPGVAAIYSLLLPGMGELYVGEYGSGKYFTIVDGALVVALVSFDRYANWLKDDSRQFAAAHAHTSVDGKDDQFFSDIGDYQTVYDFNEAALRNRQPQKVYDPRSGFYWSWDSPVIREQYRSIRVSSDDRFNDTRFIVAAMAVNHLVSAINAARLAIRHNKSLEEGQLLDIHADVIGGIAHPGGIMITLSRTF
jgi:TM2 domain-containing membrane protein YozV